MDSVWGSPRQGQHLTAAPVAERCVDSQGHWSLQTSTRHLCGSLRDCQVGEFAMENLYKAPRISAYEPYDRNVLR